MSKVIEIILYIKISYIYIVLSEKQLKYLNQHSVDHLLLSRFSNSAYLQKFVLFS